MQIADQMDLASKEFIKLSKKLNLKAEQIRENATAERDNKRGIVFMSEVTDPREKHELTKNRRPHRMKYMQELKPVITHPVTVSDDEEMPAPTNNDPDTRFLNVKQNMNDKRKHQFQCDTCAYM